MNASPGITVTPSGMVTAARSVFAKAALFICVTVEGIEDIGILDSGSTGSLFTGGSSSEGSGSSGGSVVEKVGNVVSEKMVESGQEPGLTYREVTYDDGNIRQYDKDTGELIGSTFDSDQSKLPSME